MASLFLAGASFAADGPASQPAFDDHQNMLDQLGIRALRPGPDPKDQSIFNEANANRFAATMPDALRFKDGTKLATADQWPRRRAEIVEDFEREIYGRIPKDVPNVMWEVKSSTPGKSGGIDIITRQLIGHVDNAACPALSVDIEASITVPASASAERQVPVVLAYTFNFGPRPATRPGTSGPASRAASRPGPPRASGPSWQEQAIAHGWGYGTISPASIQPDNNQLRTGIIGLTNKGQSRKPDDWGALRAWAWGASKVIDFVEAHPEIGADPKRIGIEGLSRYGKAALVAQAFDERVAVGLIGSSGEGGAKLHRHIFGEAVETLASSYEYHWMAGNFIKYGASDPEMTPGDMPVDSHELIALCAPRPCFISYGIPEKGDAHWVDARGSFMAGVLASDVYELLGKRGFGIKDDYIAAKMPPVNQLIGGELAWRQHDGGHDVTPNWPTFFEWAGQFIPAK
jgi:hypothetical protein